VQLRVRIRSARVRVGLLQQSGELVAALVVEVVLARALGIHIRVELLHDRAGVVALALLLRETDEKRAVLRAAELLNRGIGELGAEPGQRNFVPELEDDARAAREVDAEVDALGEEHRRARADDQQRDDHRVPAVLDEVVIGIFENLHGRFLAGVRC